MEITAGPATRGTHAHTRTRPTLWARKREERLANLVLHLDATLARCERELAQMHTRDPRFTYTAVRVGVLDRRMSDVMDVYDAHVLRHMPAGAELP
jgi:uncharacterized membrane protein YccC